MPFGLTNAPSTFQAAMNEMLREELRRFTLVFFYDILIYSKTWEQHKIHVQTILQKLRTNHFYAKLSKCQFGVNQIEYLGHIISNEGVSTDPGKVAAMTEWPVPKSVKELRGFLGLTGYYRWFIKHYGVIAKPLTRLLQKGAFEWNDTAQTSFVELKKAMVTRCPILMNPLWSRLMLQEEELGPF